MPEHGSSTAANLADGEHWARVETLFHRAQALAPQEWAQFLENAAGDDDGLRREVAGLLAAGHEAEHRLTGVVAAAAHRSLEDARPGVDTGSGVGQSKKVGRKESPWSRPPSTAASPLRTGHNGSDHSIAHQAPQEATADEGERWIGPYRLLHELGRGGQGTVYLAERADGQFRMQVALKVIRRGLDTADILARFHQERQILAHLDHPNIARLLDGGETPEGQPFFVLEHVEGEPIDLYCDRQRSSLGQRLRLLREVCSAVQHIHSSLIIHRDLKPSNILVTADGVPKLLDFGIAKLLAPDQFQGRAVMTDLGHNPLTPAYASPEQVRARPLTTATDVHALGLLLYRLLTGCAPLRLEGLTPAEQQQHICEVMPPRPSQTFSAHYDASSPDETPDRHTRAEHRGEQAPRLRRRLRGDLDRITLQAVRKDPEQRYASALQLAEDIDRHLRHEPVRAQPDNWRYRFGKFLRRHLFGSAMAVALMTTIIAGAAATVWHARAAKRILELFEGTLQAMDPYGLQEAGSRDDTQSVLERNARNIADAHLNRDDRRRVLRVLGRTYLSLGQSAIAAEVFSQALDGEEVPSPRASLDDLQLHVDLGSALYRSDRFDAALERLEAAVEQLRGGGAQARSLRLRGLASLAASAHAAGLGERAEQAKEEALVLLRSGPLEGLEAAQALHSLARLQHESESDFKAAEELVTRSLDLYQEVVGADHPAALSARGSLAAVLDAQGRRDEAAEEYRTLRVLQEEKLGARHPDLAYTMNNLATTLRDPENPDSPTAQESIALYYQALEILPEGEANSLRADIHNNLGLGLRDQGRNEEARRSCDVALSLRQDLHGAEHPNTAMSHNCLALVALDDKRWRDAEQHLLAVLPVLQGAAHLSGPLASVLGRLERVYLELSQPQEAAQYRRQLEQLVGENPTP